MNFFEQASKLKLRFATDRGWISTEDLWDLPLINSRVSLDNVAKGLNRELKSSEEESFVTKKSSADEITSLKFEIVKHIISVKMDEIEVNEKKVINMAKKNRILAILAAKEDAELEGKSADELKELLAEI